MFIDSNAEIFEAFVGVPFLNIVKGSTLSKLVGLRYVRGDLIPNGTLSSSSTSIYMDFIA